MDPAGNPDPRLGILEFIIGTGRRVARHGDSEHAESPGVGGPVLRRDEAKLRLLPDGYTGDYESAMESPTAPAGTPPTYGDQGFGTGKGAQDGESVVWGYGRGGNRGGADR